MAKTEAEIRSCDNCNKIHEKVYSNGGKSCFGIVDFPFRACDIVRHCQKYDDGKEYLVDVSVDEAAEILAGYAAVVNGVVAFTYKRPCYACDKEDADCQGITYNAGERA